MDYLFLSKQIVFAWKQGLRVLFFSLKPFRNDKIRFSVIQWARPIITYNRKFGCFFLFKFKNLTLLVACQQKWDDIFFKNWISQPVTTIVPKFPPNLNFILISWNCLFNWMYLRLSELGLPKRNSTHAKQIAMASIEMIHLCSNFTMEHMPTIPLQIRVGVHSGKKRGQI